MAASQNSPELIQVVTLLAATVVAVPLFRRAGLGSVLGYLFAGLVIGPFGLQLFTNPQAILHVAELGVVMFLFVIGLEMRPSHLWGLRNEIFGLGSLQIAVCTLGLTGIGILFGYPLIPAFIAASGFVLTSTAVVMQLLSERGDVGLPHGQKVVSILLFEDLLIVPLLAIVALLSPIRHSDGIQWVSLLIAMGSVTALILAGVWLLNPLFRLLAAARAREVLTAAALLVVLGSALLMQVSGLSMAMGTFLAGVLLAESSFRHQIEADIEPFRGLLLGLFFIGVGMSLDLNVVGMSWPMIVGGLFALMAGKAVSIYIVARVLGSAHREALDRAVIMAQGGEFAFVLFAAAAQAQVVSAEVNANMTAIVVLSMALTPLVVIVAKRLLPAPAPSTDGVEEARDLTGSALLLGFGRFGQVVCQLLLPRNIDVTIIDSDPDRIRNAQKFGFKVYYGDGSQLQVLHASGAATARIIAVCTDKKSVTNHIVDLIQSEFRQAKILARSYDRVHARELVLKGVDAQMRETFECAMSFGEMALRELEVPDVEVMAIAQDIRRRDRERLEREVASGGMERSRELMHSNIPTPEPLLEPKRATKLLNTGNQQV